MDKRRAAPVVGGRDAPKIRKRIASRPAGFGSYPARPPIHASAPLILRRGKGAPLTSDAALIQMEVMTMKMKQLRELLADFPDDADVSIDLDDNGSEFDIDTFNVLWSGGEDPSKANKVYLNEPEPENSRDFPLQVRLGIPDEFLDHCHSVNVTPEQVLHGFIADLCEIINWQANPRQDKLNSNGSDERWRAQEYFDRCGYADMAKLARGEC
jgi:hypothetical protein